MNEGHRATTATATATEMPGSLSRSSSKAVDVGAPDEAILQQVEQLDRAINASVSSQPTDHGAARGGLERSPLTGGLLQRRPSLLQRRPSAVAALRTALNSQQPSSPTMVDTMLSDRRQHSARESASAAGGGNRTPSPGRVLPPSSTAARKVHPHAVDAVVRGSSRVAPASADAAAGSAASPAEELQAPEPAAPPPEPTPQQYTRRRSSFVSRADPSDRASRRRSSVLSVGGDDALGKRRKSVSSFVEGVASLAHSLSKVFDKPAAGEAEERRQAKIAELVDKEVLVLNAAQLAQIQQRSATPFTISVNSPFRRWWDFVIALSTAFVMFEVPIKVGFSVPTSGVAAAVDGVVDVCFLLDILLNFVTSFEDESSGEEIKDMVKIRQNYLHGWFIIDAVSSVPSSFLGPTYDLVSLAKVLKLSQMSKISNSGLFKALASRVNRSMNPSMLRMLTLTLVFVVSQHFIACTYFFISATQAEHTSWGPSEATRASSLGEQYVSAFYFAIMVTTANDVSPSTSTEKLFTALMLFVGIVINASIIGSAANLLSNLDKAAIARKNQMDGISEYMRFKKVPLPLQDKIRRFYDYALTSRIRDPTEDLFVDLPDRLKLALKLNLHEGFIRKAPLFRVCSHAGIIAIVQCLKPVVTMPRELIVRQGEVTNEFYFIKSGRVSVSVQSVTFEVVPLGNLGEGSFFGETSLLTGAPQGADVRAESIAELAYLTQRDFSALADKFPTFHLAVKRISESRMQTAQNVRKMFKPARRPTTVPVRKGSLRAAAMLVMQRGSKAFVSDPSGAAAGSARKGTGPASRFSARLSSSRRKPPASFNTLYVDGLSLAKARELTQIRAISDVVIDTADEVEPSWGE
ncbi:hypothetical protein PybrP1_012166 [[Pythium] brassicae (nom. inval.)]|nr:hypothetical protein PybrP1_012166 [[Pythium] brassicae (nom. inval.)]